MKQNATNLSMRSVTASKSALHKIVFLSISVLALLSATAYADVCPTPDTLRFERNQSGSGQWMTSESGWTGEQNLVAPDNVQVKLSQAVIRRPKGTNGDEGVCIYTYSFTMWEMDSCDGACLPGKVYLVDVTEFFTLRKGGYGGVQITPIGSANEWEWWLQDGTPEGLVCEALKNQYRCGFNVVGI